MKVDEYKEIVEYISDSYNHIVKTPFREFLPEEDITVKIVISGLNRKKAKELKDALQKAGFIP